MKTRAQIMTGLLLLTAVGGSAQVTLQPWTQVFGTVNGQQLGSEVKGIVPTINLPFKASIKSFGNTGLYTLQTQSDTGARRIFMGNNMQTGDLNGDGLKDVLARNGNAITIYWGTATSIDTINPLTFTGIGDFGRSICIANIVGDATADLIIGAPNYPTASVSQGRVSIYSGGATFDTIPTVILNGDSTRYYLGINCAVGDLNNDGYNDLCVRGWYQVGPTPQRFDYVDVWFGGVTFDTTRDMRLRSASITSPGLACFDTNGDRIADLLWTNADSATWVYVHYGGANFDSLPNLRLQNPGVANFGNAITNVGDMSGDGNIEIAVAASLATITSGFVFIFEGGARLNGQFDAAVGMQSNSDFGRSVSSVGDITGDGLTDVIIGAPMYAFGDSRGYWGIFKGDSTITDVREIPLSPHLFMLHQAYPNPFNPKSTIRYDLLTEAFVRLEVFNLLGQRIALLVNENKMQGLFEAVFDGSAFASAVYLYRLTTRTSDGKTYVDTKKLLLVR